MSSALPNKGCLLKTGNLSEESVVYRRLTEAEVNFSILTESSLAGCLSLDYQTVLILQLNSPQLKTTYKICTQAEILILDYNTKRVLNFCIRHVTILLPLQMLLLGYCWQQLLHQHFKPILIVQFTDSICVAYRFNADQTNIIIFTPSSICQHHIRTSYRLSQYTYRDKFIEQQKLGNLYRIIFAVASYVCQQNAINR